VRLPADPAQSGGTLDSSSRRTRRRILILIWFANYLLFYIRCKLIQFLQLKRTPHLHSPLIRLSLFRDPSTSRARCSRLSGYPRWWYRVLRYTDRRHVHRGPRTILLRSGARQIRTRPPPPTMSGGLDWGPFGPTPRPVCLAEPSLRSSRRRSSHTIHTLGSANSRTHPYIHRPSVCPPPPVRPASGASESVRM